MPIIKKFNDIKFKFEDDGIKFKNHPDFKKYEKNTPIFFPKLFK